MSVSQPDIEIVPVVRSFRGMARLSKLGLRVLRVNTDRLEELVEVFRGTMAVINVTTGDWMSAAPDAERFHRACRQAGVRRFIHMSTAAVFGAVEQPETDDDSEPGGAEWFLYAAEKVRAESYLRSAMNDTNGPQIIVLRPGLIWGPRSGWVIQAVRQLRAGNAYLAGKGEGICNLCHVDNVARYIFQAVQAGGTTVEGFYNIGDNETITWNLYYQSLAEGIGLNAERVVPLAPRSCGLSAALVVEWVKSQRVGYRFVQWLINSLSPKSKSLIKWYLLALRGDGAVAPPLAPDCVIPTAIKVAFTREIWTLHHTKRKLSCAKFDRNFGKPVLLPWETGMAGTIAWLKQVGFGDM